MISEHRDPMTGEFERLESHGDGTGMEPEAICSVSSDEGSMETHHEKHRGHSADGEAEDRALYGTDDIDDGEAEKATPPDSGATDSSGEPKSCANADRSGEGDRSLVGNGDIDDQNNDNNATDKPEDNVDGDQTDEGRNLVGDDDIDD